MMISRRGILHLTATAAALPLIPTFARALDYPTRPVRFVVQFPAGTVSDILARTIAEPLSKLLGQPVIIDDQPGAGGNLATDVVVRARPDGYTLLEASSTNVWNAVLYKKLNFDFMHDIAPVASISRTQGVMAVTPSFPATTVPDFIAYAKENPGKINMASGGIGTLPHVAGELFKFMTGVNLVHVPYRGSYLPDLLSGQTQVAFGPIPTVIEQIRAGKLRALAVTGTRPSAALPNVPTLDKFVQGYQVSAFNGVGAPKSTPAEIINKFNVAVTAALGESDIQARFAQIGSEPVPMSPGEFGKLIADETGKWRKVLAGIKLD
jgi:tripartite-type tricarboxylate transporter receptor subunit TctC